MGHDLPPVLSVDEVCRLVDCKPATVEDEARRRLLPGLKIGRTWRFPREALLAELNRRALAQLVAGGVAAEKGAAVRAAKLHVVAPAVKKASARRRSPLPLGDPPVGVGAR